MYLNPRVFTLIHLYAKGLLAKYLRTLSFFMVGEAESFFSLLASTISGLNPLTTKGKKW